MTNHVAVAVANALVSALQSAGFAEAELRAVPYLDAAECASRKCVVICRNATYQDGTRGDYETEVELSVVLEIAQSPDDADALADNLANVAIIADLWGNGGALRYATLAGAEYRSGPEHPTRQLYDLEILGTHGIFLSTLVIRYMLEPAEPIDE